MSINNKNILRIIALITMTIDHIGFVLLNNNIIFRIIGRIAFPIFAYQFVDSFILTSNKTKYFLQLLLCAIISQPIYMILFKTYTLNILFTFSIMFVFLYILDRYKENKIKFSIGVFLAIIVAAIIFKAFSFDWGRNGFYIVLIFYLYKNNNFNLTILNISYVLFVIFAYWQNLWFMLFLCLPLLLINIFERKQLIFKIKINKWISYLYYPLHLFIIYFLI